MFNIPTSYIRFHLEISIINTNIQHITTVAKIEKTKKTLTHIENSMDRIGNIRGLGGDPICDISGRDGTISTFKKRQVSLQNPLEDIAPNPIHCIQRRVPQKRLLPVAGDQASQDQSPQDQTLVP